MTKIAKTAIHVATCADIGFFPWAPGTLASLLTLIPIYFLRSSIELYLLVLILVLVIGTWTAGLAEKALGTQDPGPVVIDEVAGMMIAAFYLPHTWPYLVAAFALFRLLDIWKPFPIYQLQRLPAGWGIMLDDVAAGLVANGLLQVVAWSLFLRG